ncbi:hypothetical protein [Rubrivirga marina]|uniref:Uncharacterized protein n=1 Tax=Rubrivirga marina TaxID=1196024 RepID=A0A271IXP7_9BACT|nr:hypothetical protein [Rubrivirga marina]PAP75299.1 hypothetical protein BSZ37_01995 [Rubrivirga marina]
MQKSSYPSPTLRLETRTRPLRAAFLVAPDTLPADAFDALIETCQGAWGGGFWPIIPTDGETISDDYWRLLSLTDPDVVTAAFDLSDDLKRRIEVEIGPAHLEVRPVDPADSHPLVRTGWPIRPLASTGVFRHHQRQAHFFSSDTPLVWFEEQYLGGRPAPTFPARRFVQRNFGYPRASWPLAHELKSLPTREILLNEKSEAAVLAELTDVRCLHYRFLCREYAPTPFAPGYLPTPAHAVVVGDSVSDALRAWNRSVTSHPRGRVLWLPTSLANDAAFLDALRLWARDQMGRSSQGPHGLVIESATVAVDRLDALSEALGTIGSVSTESFDPASLPFSGEPSRTGHRPFRERLPLLSTSATAVVTNAEATASPVTPPVVVASDGDGGWMVDLDLVDDTTPARSVNVSPRWRLPRRPALVHPFLQQGAWPRAWRVVNGGLPSVSATVDHPTVTLRVPDPWAVANALLTTEEAQDAPTPRIGHVAASEQGRRFQAAVDLFGGIYKAGQVLGSSFWRKQLLRAAGDPVASREAQVAIARRLLDERGDRTAESLATELASKLNRTMRRAGDTVRKHDVKAAYHRAVREAYPDVPRDQRPSFEEEGWPDFEWLVEQGVFLQGTDLRCPSCSLSRWHPVDDLARTVRCPECLRPFALPADPGWFYQLNGLVRSAIADDAVLPLIDTAYALARDARTHARVWPPLDLREGYDAAPFTDLDVCILLDGRLVVGEVKSSASGFDDRQLATLATVAAAVAADEIVLAAPAETWTDDQEAGSIQVVRDALPMETHVRTLRLAPDPYF